mmetsp:Transcript_44134/g.103710  ORF Transcript_44134/g.103710 Transcript_44134/m.103710 type:complete len:205 (-) Transcript_44134:1583-2197(-)
MPMWRLRSLAVTPVLPSRTFKPSAEVPPPASVAALKRPLMPPLAIEAHFVRSRPEIHSAAGGLPIPACTLTPKSPFLVRVSQNFFMGNENFTAVTGLVTGAKLVNFFSTTSLIVPMLRWAVSRMRASPELTCLKLRKSLRMTSSLVEVPDGAVTDSLRVAQLTESSFLTSSPTLPPWPLSDLPLRAFFATAASISFFFFVRAGE